MIIPPHCQGVENEFQRVLRTFPPPPAGMSWDPISVEINTELLNRNRLGRVDEQYYSRRGEEAFQDPGTLEQYIFQTMCNWMRYGFRIPITENDPVGRGIRDYAKRVVEAHFAVVRCSKSAPMREQFAVESMARQGRVLPEQAKLVNEFLNVRDPRRVYTDATTGTGTGVSVPRGGGRRSKKSKRRSRKTRRSHK